MNSDAPSKISAGLPPQLGSAVMQLRNRGYTDSELIRRGIRLVAKEEGILLGGTA